MLQEASAGAAINPFSAQFSQRAAPECSYSFLIGPQKNLPQLSKEDWKICALLQFLPTDLEPSGRNLGTRVSDLQTLKHCSDELIELFSDRIDLNACNYYRLC